MRYTFENICISDIFLILLLLPHYMQECPVLIIKAILNIGNRRWGIRQILSFQYWILVGTVTPVWWQLNLCQNVLLSWEENLLRSESKKNHLKFHIHAHCKSFLSSSIYYSHIPPKGLLVIHIIINNTEHLIRNYHALGIQILC